MCVCLPIEPRPLVGSAKTRKYCCKRTGNLVRRNVEIYWQHEETATKVSGLQPSVDLNVRGDRQEKEAGSSAAAVF